MDWVGFPADRTRVLFEDGVPHAMHFCTPGLWNLGIGTFLEVAVVPPQQLAPLLVTMRFVGYCP